MTGVTRADEKQRTWRIPALQLESAIATAVQKRITQLSEAANVQQFPGTETPVDPTRVVEDLLSIAAPFQHRKRGVETKLILGTEPAEVDKTLLRNIGHAHRYFDLVRSGEVVRQIWTAC